MKIIELTAHNFSEFGKGIAQVHLAAYSKKHLTANFSLGKLEKYYRYLVDAGELSIVAIEPRLPRDNVKASQVLGFIVAGPFVSRGVFRFLHDHRLYVLWVMLKHPIFIFQKFHAKLISRFRNATSEAKFRLLSIAVRSDAQSRGIGRKMLDAFEETLNSRGIVCYGLSVRGDNRKAISFYEKNGFFLEKEFPESKYYQKRLNMS